MEDEKSQGSGGDDDHDEDDEIADNTVGDV